MSELNKNNENTNGSKGFNVPDDYFTSFSNSVMNKIEWLEEHQAYPQLNSLKGKHGFELPENYFQKLEIKNELLVYPSLFAIQKENNFVHPKNYFEELPLGIAAHFEDAVFEKLDSLDKVNSFSVPENYFEQAGEKINEAVLPSAKILSLQKINYRYVAVAALFIVCIGAWLFSSYFNIDDKDCTSLACIEKSELMKNKNLENIDMERLYEVVDTKKLEESLSTEITAEPSSENDSTIEIDLDDLPEEI